MTEPKKLNTSRRDQHQVPAEFLEVTDSVWSTPNGPQEAPTLRFLITENVLGLNLKTITDVVVTVQDAGLFGVEFVYDGESFDPNMLIMGGLSLSAMLEAWQEVKSTE